MSKPVHTVKAKHAAKPASGGKKKLRHMIVKPAANGGATVEHAYSDPADPYGQETQTHVFSSGKKAGQHVAQMCDSCAPGATPDDDEAGEA
jgi:hypothetical protein